jgi:hypothetical protein
MLLLLEEVVVKEEEEVRHPAKCQCHRDDQERKESLAV